MNRITLSGTVAPKTWVHDWLGIDTINYKDLKAQLDGMSGDVEIYINTYGGSVYEGVDIYNLIQEYNSTKGKVTTIAMAKVMSIGTLILCAGHTSKAHKNSTIMCHNAWTWQSGNRVDFERQKNILEGIDTILAEEYSVRTGEKVEDILSKMTDEIWLVGRKQIEENGFVDEIIDKSSYVEGESSSNGSTDNYKNFQKEFIQMALELSEPVDISHTAKTLQACGVECMLQAKKVVENPTVNGKQVFNDSKGDKSMDYEKLYNDLKAEQATSKATIEALNATVGDKDKLLAEKESEITALKETHNKELNAHSKVFRTVLASGKHFKLDSETLQVNMDKAVAELKTNDNYSDGFVSYTVNALVLANVETDGAFVTGGGEGSDEEDSTPKEPTAEQTEKILSMI